MRLYVREAEDLMEEYPLPWKVVPKKDVLKMKDVMRKEYPKRKQTLTAVARFFSIVYPIHDFRVGKNGKVHSDVGIDLAAIKKQAKN